MNDEKLTKPMIRKRIRDVESLSIEEWSKKYPNYYQWLLDNGFRYRECYDKNRMKKLKSLSTSQSEGTELSSSGSHSSPKFSKGEKEWVIMIKSKKGKKDNIGSINLKEKPKVESIGEAMT